MPDVQHKRGTRADLNTLATADGLLIGQIYVITDEDKLAVAKTIGTYQAMAREDVLTSPAISNPTLTGSVVEDIFALTGTTPALEPANGTIQTWTLSGNSTPTDSLVNGESILIMVNDGTAFTITWPSVTWVNGGGVAPTLATTGFTVISLWKVSSVLYGALVGNGS